MPQKLEEIKNTRNVRSGTRDESYLINFNPPANPAKVQTFHQSVQTVVPGRLANKKVKNKTTLLQELLLLFLHLLRLLSFNSRHSYDRTTKQRNGNGNNILEILFSRNTARYKHNDYKLLLVLRDRCLPKIFIHQPTNSNYERHQRSKKIRHFVAHGDENA